MSRRDSFDASLWIAAGFGAFWFLCGCGLLKLVVLKETPDFWTNAGGYPVGLREFVGLWFYPLFLLTGAGMAVTSAWAARRVLRSAQRPGVAALLAVLPAWALYMLVIGILVANNLMNLVAGRPIHAH